MRTWIFTWLSVASLPAADLPPGAVPMEMIAAPAVSPDGKSMVFEWAEDLWTASTDGGEAKRLVENPGRDAYPRYTPDGKRVVFSSDRSGSMQVFSMAVNGGEVNQHTFHSEGNRLECISPDGRRALVRGVRENPETREARLLEISLTGDQRERRLFDAAAHGAAWSPDGGSLLFCRGGELSFRKGYNGSRASQIWLYQTADHSFKCMANGEAEAFSPLWLPDAKGFYYVSNRDGCANLWRETFGSPAVAVTRYQGDGVLSPDLSADGSTLVFRRGLGVLRFRPETDAEPVSLKLWTREPLPDVSTSTRKINGTASADFTGDLEQVVFAAAGDLWAVSTKKAPPVRLTDTAAAEEEVMFSPSGEWLYFRRDDGLEMNYHRARFKNGGLSDEEPVTHGARSKSRLEFCPNRLKIAWIEGTGDVFTANADGSDARCVFKRWDKPTYDWSPDGRWLVIAAEGPDSNRDLWLADAEGGQEARNLTETPGFEGSPKWSPDGRWIIFNARRDASGESGLWRIDLGKNGLPADLSAEAARALGDKAKRVSTKGIEPIRVIWTPDSKEIRFQSQTASSMNLYSIGTDGKNMRSIAKERGIPIRITADGTLLWRVKQTPETWKDGKTTRFPISCSVKRPREAMLRLAFLRIWRTLGERFYNPEMNGCDWPALRVKYESAATNARSSKQFDRVIGQLLGELNASHLVFQRRPWPEDKFEHPREDATAHPGWIFRNGDADPAGPLVIERVIAGSPASLLEDAPQAGDTVVRIAGEEVSNGTPLWRFFNGAEKRPLPVVLRDKDGHERVIELRCISYSKVRSLVVKERLARTEARVAEVNPDATYLKVPDMSRDSLEALALAVYRASSNTKGIILDFRNNGGGREADRMLGLFCQPAHSITVPRDGPEGYPIDRRPSPAWNGPLVVMCNENTYSNAEIFCHAVKQIKRAPLVGIATSGGVISAVKTTIPDVGEMQVPFRGWYHIESRKNLDLNGAQPDHRVEQTPADEDSGRDPQLEKALELLK
jgi:tricorn protease